MGLIFHLFVGFIMLSQLQMGSSYILICYFTNWAQYRTGIGRYVPQQIDPFLCTHLIYAFAIINEDHQVTTSDANDETFYAILNGLKRKNLHLKTLLSVGGFQFGSSRFNSMVPTHATRLVFIKSAINFLRQYEFDGLDLAWLYPGAGGNPTKNKKLYTKLVRELNLAFINEVQRTKQPRLLLSASMSAGKQLIDDSYEIDKLADYLDFMIVMAFDFHGPWDTFIGHHSPLYQRKDEYGHMKHLNVDFAVKYYRTKGSPGHKLLVGIPTYGRTFSLQTSDITIGAPVNGPGPKAKYTNQDGIMGYFEICEFLKSAELHWDADQLIPYAAKGRIWVGYDNLRSLDMKVKWLKAEKFGGAAVWTLDLDDIVGNCRQGPYPLVRRLQMQLSVASGLQLNTIATKVFLAVMAIIKTT